MSDRLLTVRRARGWSQERLIHEIERQAASGGIRIATTASLRVYVSKWENGKRKVPAQYRPILRSIFGATDQELFDDTPVTTVEPDNEYAELVAHIDQAGLVDRTMLDALSRQTDLLRTFDLKVGATTFVDQIMSHVETLRSALNHAALPSARRPLATELAGAASLAAWQALDVGQVQRSWEYYGVARSAALEAGSVALYAHAMGEQAYVLHDLGKVEDALELARAAVGEAGTNVPPRLTAWLLAAEAEMRAALGDVDGCRQALDRATHALPHDGTLRDREVPGVFLDENHLARWRGQSLALIGDEHALGDLYAALAGIDHNFVRAEAGMRCNLARAHLSRGEVNDARHHLRQATLLANRTGSIRHKRRIEQLGLALG